MGETVGSAGRRVTRLQGPMKRAVQVTLQLIGVLIASFAVGAGVVMLSIQTKTGGTITGRVTFSGQMPAVRAFAVSRFPNAAYCSKHPSMSRDGKARYLREVRVGPNRALREAIVAVRDITDEAWMQGADRTAVFADRCEWTPHTGVVVDRGRFVVANRDADPGDATAREGVLHRPHLLEVGKPGASTLFTSGLPRQGDAMDGPIILRHRPSESVVHLQCDQHDYMQAWFLPVTNRYYRRVEDDGTFTLIDIPAGKHTLLAWHPVAGMLERDIDVVDGATVNVDFDLPGT